VVPRPPRPATPSAPRWSIPSSISTSGVAALCHISHPYTDGTSLYFTFFFRTADDPDATTDRWARAKRAASEALVASGATITHHHGVGRWHAPWLEAEIGPTGRRLLEAAAQAADPAGILNPQILLDPTDRLEA
jgi:alkyldihydroxyacetonephosphate synthase